ncbi:MAG TPA: hypothetical protein VNQ77_01630 [Frankiaceae bacterium]|nr:hypothetical protein [Frankiaceae bacterium]
MGRASGTMDAVAAEIVKAMREDRDADVFNLIERAAGEDPMKLAWALARLAATNAEAGR